MAVGFLLQSGPDPTSGPSPAEASERDPGPLHNQWTPTAEVYRNEDGTNTAKLFATEIQFPDASSETGWSPVDTGLKSLGNEFVTKGTEASIRFSSGDAGPLAAIERDGERVSLFWEGDLPAPTITGDTAVYESVLPGTDAILQARSNGFEQSFLVDAPENAPRNLAFPLQLGGLKAAVVDGGLVLTNGAGDVVGGGDTPRMWGAELDPITGAPVVEALVEMSLVDDPDGLILTLEPDPSFFARSDLTYPVTIDPSINLSLVHDAYVNSSSPTSSYGSALDLRAGLVGVGSALHRSFISFNSAPIEGKHILSASLQLYETWSYSCTPSQVNVYSLQGALQPPITWNNQPAIGTLYASTSVAKGFSASCPAGAVTLQTGGANGLTLTDLVQQWTDPSTVPYGLAIRAHDEADTNGGKVFKSSEATTDGPVLSVTYNSYPDVPIEISAEGPVTTPTLHARFSDADGGTGYVAYTVYTYPYPTVLLTGNGPTVSSGSDSPYTVPSGYLQSGQTYLWSASAHDGTDQSPAPPRFYPSTPAIVTFSQETTSWENSETQVLEGEPLEGGGCIFPVPDLSLTAGYNEVAAKQLSADFNDCTTTVQIGNPTEPDPEEASQPEGVQGIEDGGETSGVQATNREGYYEVKWQDLIHKNVNWIRTWLNWDYNGSCTTRRKSWVEWWYRYGTGWRKSYVNGWHAEECVNIDVWSDAKFTNSFFCWPATVFVRYEDVTFIGWYDGYYQGRVYKTWDNSRQIYGCFPLHYHVKLVKTKG
jgi:hypothetical protein